MNPQQTAAEVKQTQPKSPEQVTEVKQVGDSSVVLATISTRAVAIIIDTLILMFLGLGFSFSLKFGNNNPSGLLITLIWFGYFIGLESYSGQTIGKMATGIKVLDINGGKITPQQAIIRNLLRIVDGLPCFYIVGIIIASNSKLKQRFGDNIAKTIVVKA